MSVVLIKPATKPRVTITREDLLSHLPVGKPKNDGSGILQPDEVDDKPRTKKQLAEEEDDHTHHQFDDVCISSPLEEELPEILMSDLVEEAEPEVEVEEDEDEDEDDDWENKDEDDNWGDDWNDDEVEDEDEEQEEDEDENGGYKTTDKSEGGVA